MIDNKLETLSPDQIIAALAPHIQIKQFVMGASGTTAKIDSESKDVDYPGLTVAQNAFIFHSFGPAHPMSYYLSGKIPLANGGPLFFDEWLRSEKAFRDLGLNLIENHQLNRGGAPAVDLDIFVIGASNQESVEDAEKNPLSKAHLDRTRRVPMPYLLNPLDQAQLMLSMRNDGKTLLMQELDSQKSNDAQTQNIAKKHRDYFAKVPADFDKLFTLPEGGKRRLGPDRRYKLWFDQGPGEECLHLSPHTLMFMSYLVVASRMVADPKQGANLGEKHVLKDIAYRDKYTRIQVLMGEHNINAADRKDLRSLSRDQKEGYAGITERDAANSWLDQVISEAQKNGHCLTPDLVHNVFLELLEQDAIYYPTDEDRGHWIQLSEELFLRFLVPAFESDVNTALGAGLGAVNSMYDEVFKEILTLSSDLKAEKYKSARGEVRLINKERLKEIKKIYEEAEGKMFSPQELVLVYAIENDAGEKRRHPGLLKAVTSYLAQRETDKLTYDDFLQFSDTQEGNTDIREKYNELSHIMCHQLGYCKTCLNAALMIVRQAKSRSTQVK